MRNLILIWCVLGCFIIPTMLNAQIPTDSLMSFYSFNGNADDIIGGLNGNPQNISYVSDRFGNPNSAAWFNGIDSYIEIPTTSGFNYLHEGDAFTISLWAKIDTIIGSPHQYRILCNTPGGNVNGVEFYFNDPDEFSFYIGRSPAPYPVIHGIWPGSFPGTKIWFHVAIAYDSSLANGNLKFYLNGQFIGDTTKINPHVGGDALFNMFIGRYLSSEDYFHGALDDLRFYHRALTEQEIQALYHENGYGSITTYKGWTHEGCDMAWSDFYPYPSSVTTGNHLTKKFALGVGTIDAPSKVLTGDVNGDGNLEIVYARDNLLTIFNGEGSGLFSSSSLFDRGELTLLADVNNDSVLDIGIGANSWNFGSGDLYVKFYDYQGNLLKSFAKTGGYDASLRPRAVFNNKLIAENSAGYSLDPRGWSLIDLNTGAELWYYDIGCHIFYNTSIADADNDGILEITGESFTSHNGATGNGNNGNGTYTTDGDIWCIVIDANGNEVFSQMYPAPRDGRARHYFVDFDYDGYYEILALESHDPTYYHGTSQIHLFDAQNGTTLYSFDGGYDWAWSYPMVCDINNDGLKEIIVSNRQGWSQVKHYIFDHNLNILDSSSTRGTVLCGSDLNGDGDVEIVLGDSTRIKVLDKNLNLVDELELGGLIQRAIISDVDNNGANEIIVLADSIYSLEFDLQTGGANPPIFAATDSIQGAGTQFWVDLQVGDAANPVTDLFGVSFSLHYTNTQYIDVVSPYGANVLPGSFMGTNVIFLPFIDDPNGQVDIGISRQAGQGGVSGYGPVARIQFAADVNTPHNTPVTFTIDNITANDPGGNPIPLDPQDVNITITSIIVWPGDANNDGTANVADVLPLGLYYNLTGPARPNASNTWTGQICPPGWNPQNAAYADCNGDGIINVADVLPIGLNYNQTHSKSQTLRKWLSFNEELPMPQVRYTVYDQELRPTSLSAIGAGEVFYLGFSLEQAKDFAGVSFTLDWQGSTAEPGGMVIDRQFGQNGLQVSGDWQPYLLTLHQPLESQQRCEFGFSLKSAEQRYDGSELALLKCRRTGSGTLALHITDLVALDWEGRYYQGSPLVGIGDSQEPLVIGKDFNLQNYPNPFNPTTTIRFALPRSERVWLAVYNTLGQQVAELVNGRQLTAGAHEYRFDASTLSNGLYFYRLQVGQQVVTKKMLLMK